jgi:tetratricopeptide (TPR) repeat protein
MAGVNKGARCRGTNLLIVTIRSVLNFIGVDLNRDILLPSIAVLVVVVIAIAPYLNALTGPFIYDDLPNIVDNKSIHITELDGASLLSAGFSSPLPRRSFSYITFAINHYFHGLDTFGYHLVNVVIHALNSILVLFIGRALLCGVEPPSGLRSRILVSSALAACVFATHPIQVQSVAYIVQRMTLLATFFVLSSFALYVASVGLTGFRKWVCVLTSAVLWTFAVASKEIAITLPALIFLHKWLIQERGTFAWIRGHLPLAGILLSVTTLAYIMLNGLEEIPSLAQMYSNRPFTLQERLLTESRVVVHYLSLIVLPTPDRLNLIHTFPLSRSLLVPISTLVSSIFLAALVVGALLVRRRAPLLSFGLLWFFINLLLESTIIALDIAYEHRLYLPLAGLAWIVGYVSFSYATEVSRATALGAPLFLVALLGTGSYLRSEVWTDELVMWRDVAAKSPDSYVALNNYASALRDRGRGEHALPLYHKALNLRTGIPATHLNIASTLIGLGRFVEAEAQITTMQEALGSSTSSYEMLGNIAMKQRNVHVAVRHFTKALELDSDSYTANMELGNIYVQKAQFNLAIGHLKRAKAVRFDEPYPRYLLARAYDARRNFKRAIREYRDLTKITDDSLVLFHFADSLINVAALTGAEKLLSQVVLRNDGLAFDAAVKLGDVETLLGKPDRAAKSYKIAQDLRPGDSRIREKIDKLR